MNVNQITDKIKEIAISLETVNSVFEGDVYENWNSTEIKYGSFNVGLQNVSNDGNLCTYTFVFYYSDRLTQDKSNANSIYSDGVNTIQSVINVLNYMQFDISEQINYTPFEQKFMDYLAGVYATVNIVTSSSLGFCNMDDYNIEEVIEIVKNGVYDVTNYTKAVVNVPQMGEEKDPIFTASPAYSITQSDINRWNSGGSIDLSSYVTKSELSAQSYITANDLPDYSNTYQAIGDYVTKNDLSAQSYITSNDLPDYSNTYQAKGDYITPTDLENSGYITSETDPVFSASVASNITQSDINRWNNGVTPDLSSYVTKSELSAQSYITNSDLPDYSNTYQAKGDYVTQSDLTSAGYITSETDPVFSASVAASITQSDINNWNRGGSIDLSSYVTKSELAAQSYITNADLPDYSNTYQTKGDYVTPTELSAQGYITSVTFPDYSNTYQAKGDYITPTDLNNASYVSATELSNASYVTQDTLSAQSYVTSSYIETKELVTAKALSYLYTYKVATSAFVFDAYTATLHITL